jgi:hypothetical protein
VDKNRFVQWWQKGWVIPSDPKQNPEQMQMDLPGAPPGLVDQQIHLPHYDLAVTNLGQHILQELDSTTNNGQPLSEDAKRQLFAVKMLRFLPQNHSISTPEAITLYLQLRAALQHQQQNAPIEVGDTPPNPLWEQQFEQGEIIDPRTDEQAVQQTFEHGQAPQVPEGVTPARYYVRPEGVGTFSVIDREAESPATSVVAVHHTQQEAQAEANQLSMEHFRQNPIPAGGAIANQDEPRYVVAPSHEQNRYRVYDTESNTVIQDELDYETATDRVNFLNEARGAGGVGRLTNTHWRLLESGA